MGNKRGWIIGLSVGAVVIFLLLLVLYENFYREMRPSAATTRKGKLSLKKPSEPVTSVLLVPPTGAGDAGDNYHAAFQAYRDGRDAIRTVIRRNDEVVNGSFIPTPADLAVLKPVMDALSAGAMQEKMTYSFRLTPKEIKAPFLPPEADRFQDITNVPFFLFNTYIAQGKESYPKAEKAMEVMFTVGWHMMNERARFLVVRRGFGIQRKACEALEHLYQKWGKPDRLKAVRKYHQNLDVASGAYRDMDHEVIWRIRGDLGLQGPHPGDIFNLAENHADPCVRRYATISLGMVKMTCTRWGDKRYVAKLIDEKLRSKDPIESEAARAAKAFNQDTLNKCSNL